MGLGFSRRAAHEAARGAAHRRERRSCALTFHGITIQMFYNLSQLSRCHERDPRHHRRRGYGRVFEPLRDPELFAQARVDRESGTVTWPTGADLDPIVVYEGLPPLNARIARRATA